MYPALSNLGFLHATAIEKISNAGRW